MNKQSVLILLVMLFVSFKLSASDYLAQKKSSPAQIVINHLLSISASGKKTVGSLILTATDNKGLRRGQIYTARFLKKKKGRQDGIYKQSEEEIYIAQANQVDAMVHQITLKKISKNKFAVIETTPTVIITAKRQQLQPAILPVLHHNFTPRIQNSPAF